MAGVALRSMLRLKIRTQNPTLPSPPSPYNPTVRGPQWYPDKEARQFLFFLQITIMFHSFLSLVSLSRKFRLPEKISTTILYFSLHLAPVVILYN